MINLEKFKGVRTHLFHLTANSNIPHIVGAASLLPAAEIFRRARRSNLLSTRRIDAETIDMEAARIHVRDQAPLHKGSIDFEMGWDLERLVEHMNHHVFFWPGTKLGPIPSGINHLERYRREDPFLLRIPINSLIASNERPPLFSRCNSGAPRCSGGKFAPRGSSTYREARGFDGSNSDVVEVVFRGSVVLPADTEVSASYSGPWRPLFR